MKLKTLQDNLKTIPKEMYNEKHLFLCHSAYRYYIVNQVGCDTAGNVFLCSNNGYEMTIEEIVNDIVNYDENSSVYFKDKTCREHTRVYDIKAGWYFDADRDIIMDIINSTNF